MNPNLLFDYFLRQNAKNQTHFHDEVPVEMFLVSQK